MDAEHELSTTQAGRLFNTDRPPDLRAPTRWHRHAYHLKMLPLRLEALARGIRLPAGARILDYGCAELPYRHFFPADAEFVGADLPGNPHASLKLRSDGTVPAADDSFDVVLSTQVLEHVADPALYLAECFRVLRPGGRMLLSTHGIFVYHPDPVDFWRWTCAGLQHAVSEAGFRVERFEGIVGLAATGLQLLQDAVYYRAPMFLRPILALVVQSFAAVADRFEPRASRDMNAQVFAIVAEKPGGA